MSIIFVDNRIKILKVTSQYPPATWIPWNGCSANCCHTNTPLVTCHKSWPKHYRLNSISTSTGQSTDLIVQRRCLTLQPNPHRFEPRSNKEKLLNRLNQMMKLEIPQVPWRRKNKFPVAVPWISPKLNSWYFPRSPPPIETELQSERKSFQKDFQLCCKRRIALDVEIDRLWYDVKVSDPHLFAC